METESAVKSVERAAVLLKRLAEQPLSGWRLSDLARESGLGKTTTHRLLMALVGAGFAVQDRADRRYHLGYEIVRLGQAASRYDIVDLARPALLRLTRETGDTVFFSIREGLDAVCLDRQVGDFPIKTLTLDVGDRRPLGVGAGSLALLAFLPPEEIEEIIESNRARLADYPKFAPERLRDLVERTRRREYALNDGRIVSAMSAIGVPVVDPRGRVAAAVSCAAINERMTDERIAWILALLRREAAQLSERLCAAEPGTQDRRPEMEESP